MNTINAISLFSGAGIDEIYLDECGVNVILANELIKSRAEAYKSLHKNKNVICDDICLDNVKNKIIDFAKTNNVRMVIATPPCQGLSWAGINKNKESLLQDPRNYLVLNAIEVVDSIEPDYFIIENVPRFKEMIFPYNNDLVTLEELLKNKYATKYNISIEVLDAADYGVPQTRLRVVYKMWKKGLTWNAPIVSKRITLEDAIGNLPSLESGQTTEIKNHSARKLPENHIECMSHTPTGHSAYENIEYFPKKISGEMIQGFKNTFKRMWWDRPAPTITMRNEIASSQENVHPGRALGNGLWSDARVLTLRELLIVSSMSPDTEIPNNLSETAFRQIIGEGIPPRMFARIIEGIGELK